MTARRWRARQRNADRYRRRRIYRHRESLPERSLLVATEYSARALEALADAEVEFGDARGQTNKLLATAIVYALLDVARAVRALK